MKKFNPTQIQADALPVNTVFGFRRFADWYLPDHEQTLDHEGSKDDIHFQFIYFNNPNMKERKPR